MGLSLLLAACGPRTPKVLVTSRGAHHASQVALKDLQEVRSARTELVLLSRKLQSDIQKLEGDVASRDARLVETNARLDATNAKLESSDTQLSELTTAHAGLQQRYEELVGFQAELEQRLKMAGQSVEELARERGIMTKELGEVRDKLDELRRQQAQADARSAQLKELVKAFRRLVDAGKLKVGTRRGRMVLELPNDVLFDSGKTELKEAGKNALTEVATVLRDMQNRMFQVAGHTDDVKIQSARFPSNWELSVLRAVEVTRKLIDAGMDPKNLSAAGYGEWDPAADNATPEGRAKNRRIEITLVPNIEEFIRAPETAAAAGVH